MLGVITKKDVLSHPFIIIEGFGMQVFIRALFSDPDTTFLDIVSECMEEEEHREMVDYDLPYVVGQFMKFEVRARDIYEKLEQKTKEHSDVSHFFHILVRHEEGHALVLSRVKHLIEGGHFWKETENLYKDSISAFKKLLDDTEEYIADERTLAEILAVVDTLEGSEINIVFDNLTNAIDMKSRAQFDKFFVKTNQHLSFCAKHLRDLREKYGIEQPERQLSN